MERWHLEQKQSLPLEQKEIMSINRIRDFYNSYDGQVYISYSGGVDSTVLLHIVRRVYKDIPALFANTGLEYPELVKFALSTPNVVEVKPKKTFKQVLKDEGYPVISKKTARMIRDLQNPTERNENTRKLYLEGIKRDGTKTKSFKLAKKWQKLINAPFKVSEKCCDYMKKEPFKRYEKQTGRVPFIGTMADDSDQRRATYLKTGCNNFSNNQSQPLAFWTKQDIWDYIKKYNLEYASVYDKGETNTGCIFCMFGVHLEKEPNRFQRMAKTHPQLYKYCIDKLGLGEVLDYIGVPYEPIYEQLKLGGD